MMITEAQVEAAARALALASMTAEIAQLRAENDRFRRALVGIYDKGAPPATLTYARRVARVALYPPTESA